MATASSRDAVTGVVVRIVSEKGFGFIRMDSTGEELFFHRSATQHDAFDSMVETQTRVRFIPGQGPKGPRAEQVELI